MRIHIEVHDALIAKVDELAGVRARSGFVRSAIDLAVRQAHRWSDLDAAAGSIADEGHEWDADPARWVQSQRHTDHRRAG